MRSATRATLGTRVFENILTGRVGRAEVQKIAEENVRSGRADWVVYVGS